MFLGGAPFIQQDPEVYKDESNNSETHYSLDNPENAMYFFNYTFSRHPGPIALTYGPHLAHYDDAPYIAIEGIGSIIHHLQSKIPVWILTKDGAVRAHISSVKMNLGQEYGCVSNYPRYEFSCSKNVDPSSIFGLFYVDQSLPIEKSSMLESGDDPVSYFDLDGDRVADIAKVESSFEGITNNMAVVIWYVHINNEWVVLDYAVQPDCT